MKRLCLSSSLVETLEKHSAKKGPSFFVRCWKVALEDDDDTESWKRTSIHLMFFLFLFLVFSFLGT